MALDLLRRAESGKTIVIYLLGFRKLKHDDYLCRTIYLQSVVHFNMGDTEAYDSCILKLNL